MQENLTAVKTSRGMSKICFGVLSICIGSLLFIACGGSESEEDEGGGGLVVQQDAGHSAGDAGISGDDAGVQESDAGQQGEIDGFISIPAVSFTLDLLGNYFSAIFASKLIIPQIKFSLR